MTPTSYPQALAGCMLAITAERRANELAAALHRRGAQTRHTPALSMIANVDDDELMARTLELIADPPQIVVITTGIGFRGWVEAADAAGVGEGLHAALSGARLIARGPKAKGALQAADLRADWVAESETTAEIIELLLDEGVAGTSIAVQHHGAGDDGLHRSLSEAGAQVRDLIVYRWGAPQNPELVRASARWVADHEVDGVLFTSAPAAAAWLQAARQVGVVPQAQARSRAGEVLFACVGPVTAAPLQAAGIRTLQPERFRMGALVRAVIAHFEGQVPLPTIAGDLLIRSGGALLDHTLIQLSSGSLAVLRALAASPGAVVSREELVAVLPGGAHTTHAAEAAVGRLREGLDNAGVIKTVPRRGYRLELRQPLKHHLP